MTKFVKDYLKSNNELAVKQIMREIAFNGESAYNRGRLEKMAKAKAVKKELEKIYNVIMNDKDYNKANKMLNNFCENTYNTIEHNNNDMLIVTRIMRQEIVKHI